MRRAAALLVVGVVASCAPNGVAFIGSQPPASTTPPSTTSIPATSRPAPTTNATVPSRPLPPQLPSTEESSTTAGIAPGFGAEPLREIGIDDVVDVGANKPPSPHDPLLAAAIADIAGWWRAEYPKVYGGPYAELEGGIYAGYPDRLTPIPGCAGTETTTAEELAIYAAFYCADGDFIAYDASSDATLTGLADEFGAAILPVVIAHEWGHMIQERRGLLDVNLPTITTEQQADCFAGAWVGHAYRGESELLQLTDEDIRTSLIAMLSVRDPVGTSQLDDGGHGSAFDRVGAFQVGFNQGTQRCTELIGDQLPLVPNVFQPGSRDEASGGNAPYSCVNLSPDHATDCRPAPEFLAADLNHYWNDRLGAFLPLGWQAAATITGDECPDIVMVAPEIAVCPLARTVIYDEPAIVDLYSRFGDFTLGYYFGIAWAEMSLIDSAADIPGERRALLRDCLTGAWVGDITPNAQGRTRRQGDRDGDTVISSPGDLDEAIRMAVLIGDDSANSDVIGSPFEKIGALRTGVLTGDCTSFG